MNARRILLARALALALLAPSASVKLHAQQSQTQQAQVQQEQQVDSEKRGQRYLAIPKLSPEDREEFGEQVVLQPTPSVPIFTGYTDNQLLFTSNALLTPTNEESDMIFISTTGFGIEPPMPDGWQKLHLSLNGRFQVYRYDDHDELNFHIYTGGVSTNYEIDELWSFYTSNSYSVFYSEAQYTRFFEETAHLAGITRSIPIADDLAAYAGFQFQYRNTSPASFSRYENDLFAGIRYALNEQWVAQLYERLENQEYTTADRNDWNALTALSLTYYFSEWGNARVMASYTENHSEFSVNNYSNVNAGGGVYVQIQF